jgi:alpha-amylase/alpha-mannosidase (GH57 family)
VSNIERGFFCMYGHFSQPPRGNPFTGEIGHEDDAAPYNNWNERISDRCYEPNARAENYNHISFSFSESLLMWLEANRPDVYQAVINGDMAQEIEPPQGNALATAYHHSILPLARRRDKRTQILWGIAAFENRFGRKPLGFWLPEMAVDTETLTLLVEAGLQYTLLAGQQIRDLPFNGGAGPYKVQVSRSRSIGVFVRDDRLSSEVSFKVHNLGGAGHWAHNVLGPARKSSGPLLLVATEGETFGHHYMGEDQFLHWLMTREAQAVGFTVTSLDHFFAAHPPTQSVSIHEPSSWSDQRGLANWATGQGDSKKDTSWKGALRRALDNVASELDRAYEDLLRPLGVEPWELRDQYAPVLLGAISAEEFIAQRVPDIASDSAESLKLLLSAQELAQRMYTSATFTNDALESRQPRYAIACAAAALMLAQQATGIYMADRLLSDLAVVTSKGGSMRGVDILWQVVEEFALELAE